MQRLNLITQHLNAAPAAAGVGSKIPAVELHDGFPPAGGTVVNLAERCAGKKVPEYLEKQDALKAKGIDEVIVYCVNDGAVMAGWADDQGVADSMITFLADTTSELTQALGMVLDDPGPMGVLGNPRCKRFCMFIDDGTIKACNVSEAPGDPAGDNEPDGPVTALTRVPAMLELIK